jgi:hypothetical protein
MYRQGGYSRHTGIERAVVIALSLASASVFFGAAPLGAQSLPFGIGEDASLVPRGAVRFSTHAEFSFADQLRRADGTRVPLGTLLSSDSLGASELPALGAAERALQTATNQSALRLFVGRTDASAAVSVTRIPIALEYGVTRWLTLGVSAPLVRRHVDVVVNPNARGAGGNVGLNPALDPGSVEGATLTAATQTFNAQFANAEAQFRAAITSCIATPSGPGCTRVLQDSALVRMSQTVREAIVGVYGGVDGIAPFIPLSGSAAQAAVTNSVAALQQRYQAARDAGASITVPTAGAPVGPGLPLTSTQLSAFVTNPVYGLGAADLGRLSHTNFGDVDVSAKVALFDGFRPNATGIRLRSAVTGTFRIGAGPSRNASDFLDPGAGDGQNDVEVRLSNDVAVGRRFVTSLIAAQTWQRPDRQVIRAGTSLLLDASARATVERDLGDITAFDVIPRYSITKFLAIAATGSYRRKSEDRYTGGTPSARWGLVREPLGAYSETRAGVGVVYSSRAFGRGIGGAPVELIFQHARTVHSSGADVVQMNVDQLGGRIYLHFPH